MYKYDAEVLKVELCFRLWMIVWFFAALSAVYTELIQQCLLKRN